ncbi:MAG: efflux RND transporter permease subunit, partial [Fusobacteriota bacterium]
MLKLLKKIYRRPWLIMLLTIIITIASIISVKNNAKLETNLDEYMPKDHPAFIYSNKAEDLFGIKDGVIFAIENKDGVFNKNTLEKIKKMSIELGEFEEINKDDIVSLYTADNIVGSDFGLEINSFYEDVPQTKAELNNIRDQVLENDMVFKRLISENENVALIIAELEDDKFDTGLYEKLTAFSKKYESEDEKILFAGRPMVEGTLGKLAPKDMQKMIPIVILVIIAVLYLTLKSIKGTVITFFIVALSTIWTFGLMTALNIPIYSLATMIPVMLIAIGVADGIHLFNHIREHMKDKSKEKNSKIIDNMLEELYKPVIMTSITTAVGFISLVTSKVYPVKYFGIFTAIGVLLAMLLSLVFLPAALKIIG